MTPAEAALIASLRGVVRAWFDEWVAEGGPAPAPAPAPEPAQAPAPSPAPTLPPVMTPLMLFDSGVYLYPWSVNGDRAAALRAAGAGHTRHYVAIDNLGQWLDAAQAARTHVIAQIDAAYITSTDAAMARERARVAADLVRPYAGHPALAAVSLREEPPAALMPALDAAYGEFRRLLPGELLQLTHNNTAAANVTLVNRPDLHATDRYASWGWDASAGGYCATPRSALNWFWGECQKWVKLLGRGCTIAICGSRLAMWASAAQVDSGALGTPARIRALADAGLHGWRRSGGGFAAWKYYEPPPGCVRSMVLLAHLAGAGGVLLWAGGATGSAIEREMDAGLVRASWSGELIAPCSARVQAEFAAAAQEVRERGHLMTAADAPDLIDVGAPYGPPTLVNSTAEFRISASGRVA